MSACEGMESDHSVGIEILRPRSSLYWSHARGPRNSYPASLGVIPLGCIRLSCRIESMQACLYTRLPYLKSLNANCVESRIVRRGVQSCDGGVGPYLGRSHPGLACVSSFHGKQYARYSRSEVAATNRTLAEGPYDPGARGHGVSSVWLG